MLNEGILVHDTVYFHCVGRLAWISANLNGLNVFGYLSYLLTELPKLGNEPTDEQLDNLLTWSDTLPDYCK